MADPIAAFKDAQRQSWANFALFETITMPAAARLVRFAGIAGGERVLDVGCGTGVVALTARRAGATVTGLDLTPELLARAKENAALMGTEDVAWREGDAEDLPFPDGSFDVVVSQFGHIFAPRPEVVTREMLRVLRPGGTLAVATWPPDQFVGTLFQAIGRHLPAPPAGVAPPWPWGDPRVVRERLGEAVTDVAFDGGTLRVATLGPAYYRAGLERAAGPVIKAVEALRGDPPRLAALRRDIEAVVARYFEPGENLVRQDYLLARAVKR